MRFAMHRQAVNAEAKPGCDFGQCRIGALAAGQAVGNDADMVAAVGLAIGDVEDVADDSTYRRANGMQDAKRLVDRKSV